jgi:hypothetical protein
MDYGLQRKLKTEVLRMAHTDQKRTRTFSKKPFRMNANIFHSRSLARIRGSFIEWRVSALGFN